MKTFEELKKELLDLAKSKQACEDGYKMGLLCKSKEDLLKAITSNWRWVLVQSKMIDSTFLEKNFTAEELKNAGILVSGNHEVHNETFFACGSSTVKAYGSSTVKACGSSTVEAYDSSTVEACGSSTVEAYDSSTVEACDSSTVEAYDSSTVKAYGSSTVKAYGSSTVKAYGSSYVADFTREVKNVSDSGIIRDYSRKKIYIKKGAFEIIEVE